MTEEIKNGAGVSKGTIGYTPEDYKKALGGVNSYSTNTGDNTTDYYNALKNESYKALLNSEVQASIARDQAMKYTQNSLRAKGYGNQGLAESSNLGLQSQYQTALANAANNYRADIRDIDERQRNEQVDQQKTNFESMTTLMKGSSDKSQLDNIMSTYDIGFNDDGTLDFSKSNLDSNSQKQLQILYSMYDAQFNDTSLKSLDSLNNATYIAQGSGNKVSTLGEHFNEEMKYLWHKGSSGDYTTGDTIQVKNGNGDTIYMEWTGNGFKLIDEATYNSVENIEKKHTLTWNSKKKSISYN